MPAPDLDIGSPVLDHEGPDDDIQVQVAGICDISDRPGIGAAGHGLQFVDDLHAAHLGNAGDGAAGKNGPDQIEGVPASASSPRTFETIWITWE